ncbi:hypothetical protein ASZ78_011154 [Callipepla squamata]|uniref:VHS domain-containing protein n=1 Tax=Callipepla squamata TaxID=9009 RepID=A0A226MH49_CALSU|nr:hypothetical protein ASZ78_011154 [Callipepla squamata]
MAFGKAPKEPFGTAVGSLVERATFGSLQTEEWGQFMHICDVINATEEGPKDAVKALKKKLSKNCNHKEIRLTLSLLDMCMQNCGPRFQSLIVKKDFCKDKLVKLLNPRYNLPIDLQERILTFIMTWARGFQGMVDVTEVKEVYLELLKKGVEFPSSDTSKGGPKIGKLYSELDMAKMNVRVMSSILKENVPGSENPDDMNLLQKLYKTCRMMQERIMELLVTVENEDVIVELIQVNEDLNNVLLGHERKQPSAPSSDLLDLSTDSPSPVAAVLGTDPAASQLPGPTASKNKLQSPHYYEIMEFDPLAPTEVIYEEIDAAMLKPEVEKNSGC